jgi:hypothetical protein
MKTLWFAIIWLVTAWRMSAWIGLQSWQLPPLIASRQLRPKHERRDW